MKHDNDLDQELRRQFDVLRQQDTAAAPSFASMIGHARSAAGVATAAASPTSVPAVPSSTGRSSVRLWMWAAPVLVAASLAVVVLQRPDRAEQEFEQLVTEWSRVNQAAQRSPTDRLLSFPGSEYLRSTPTVGVPPTRSPS